MSCYKVNLHHRRDDDDNSDWRECDYDAHIKKMLRFSFATAVLSAFTWSFQDWLHTRPPDTVGAVLALVGCLAVPVGGLVRAAYCKRRKRTSERWLHREHRWQ